MGGAYRLHGQKRRLSSPINKRQQLVHETKVNMARSAEEAKKTIQKLYPTLLKLLPIRKLVEHFYSLQLLSDDRKSEIDSLTSLKEKITYFLDEMLIPGLSINYTRHFDEMVTMMKESDDDLIRFLVERLMPINMPTVASLSVSPTLASSAAINTDTGIKKVCI